MRVQEQLLLQHQQQEPIQLPIPWRLLMDVVHKLQLLLLQLQRYLLQAFLMQEHHSVDHLLPDRQ